MIKLDNCKLIFIDFDGVIVDSNGFKEKAIKKSIFKIKGKDNFHKELMVSNVSLLKKFLQNF